MKQVIILLSALLIALPASAEPPNILHYQGKLVSVDDNSPVSEEVPMTFRLYSQDDSEEPLWEEEHTGDHAVTVIVGNFSVELGSIEPIDPDLFASFTLFLGITIDGEELLPRQPVGGSAYALLASKSLDAERLSGTEVADFVTEQELDDYSFLTETDVAPIAFSNDYNDLDNLPNNAGLEHINTDLLSSVITRDYNSEDTPITDPQDGEPIISTIEFPDSGTIRGVSVTLDIAHEDVSELTVTLTSPAGTTISLHQGEQEDLSINFPDDRQPSDGSLDDFIGEEASGAWTLTLSDQTIGNVGTLNSWNINITLLSSNITSVSGTLVVEQLNIGSFPIVLAPIGSVTAWLKNFSETPTLPEGWIECNGQLVEDPESPYDGRRVPNLNGFDDNIKRFLRGSITSGGIGGSEEHRHHGVTVRGGNFSGGYFVDAYSNHLPPYYEVVWIIRVK